MMDKHFSSGLQLIPVFPLIAAILLLSSCSRRPVYLPPAQSGTNVSIDIATLQPDIPKFFTYRHGSKLISFFVIIVNGEVLSFLDACASCYPHKKGYQYDKGSVICRNCNMQFPVSQLAKGLGGCFPIKIEGRREKEKYLLPISILEKAADKF